MSGIRAAKARLDEAERKAKDLVFEARAELGREILKAQREKAVPQKDIAVELHLTREQVRRYQVAARESDAKRAQS